MNLKSVVGRITHRPTIQLSRRIQRVGEVVHLIAHHLTDLSGALASVAGRDAVFPLPHGRGDELHHGGSGLGL